MMTSDENDDIGLELKPLTSTTSSSIGSSNNSYDDDDNVETHALTTTTSNDDEQSTTKTPFNNNGKSSNGGGGHAEFGLPGTSTQKQVTVNIFISFVGSGMLGMPYAFSQSGWALGVLCLCVISSLNLYAMLLLVKTRKKLERDGYTSRHIEGYGDLGGVIAGEFGERFVNVCLVISQLGFATAYIIFIAANINDIADVDRAYICFGCVPVLALLVQLKDMKHLSPFSLLADVANLAGLSAVMCQDWKAYRIHHEPVATFHYSKVLYVSAVALYSLEGVGMVLPLESSCEDRRWFPWLLRRVIFGITMLMAVFGCFGYFAFGGETMAPVTLNLEGGVATIVKLALCVGLYLTFPIMLFPVNEVMEDIFLGKGKRENKLFRCLVVVVSATVAWMIPDFGKFLSLVGASICTILGFILPSYFHLQAYKNSKELECWELMMDYFLIAFGVVFGILGTWTSFVDLLDGKGGHR